MWKMIFLILISFFTIVFSQSAQQEAQITSYEVNIPAHKITKIIMYNSDSTNCFTIFDNIIEKKQKLIFIVQPMYFMERNIYKNAIVLPFPKTNSGIFYISYSNKDTSFVKKMVFLK